MMLEFSQSYSLKLEILFRKLRTNQRSTYYANLISLQYSEMDKPCRENFKVVILKLKGPTLDIEIKYWELRISSSKGPSSDFYSYWCLDCSDRNTSSMVLLWQADQPAVHYPVLCCCIPSPGPGSCTHLYPLVNRFLGV